MIRRNFFRQAVSTLFIVSILILSTIAHAETYTGKGSYVMCELENLDVAKERAEVIAMRDAIEKACGHVKSYALSKNFDFDSDEVELVTVNVIKLAEEPHFNIDNLTISATVKTQIDDNDINSWFYTLMYESIIQYKALRRAEDKQTELIAELKSQLAANPNDKEIIAQKFAEADKIFRSHQILHEALKIYNRGSKNDYYETIRLCEKAIELNPTYNFSYNNLGLARQMLGQYTAAIQDFTKSIAMKPDCFNAYNNRGNTYRLLNQYEKALEDHNSAIRIKPTAEDSYFNRGVDYQCLDDYEKAIRDFDKALELNPKYKPAIYHREMCLRAMTR